MDNPDSTNQPKLSTEHPEPDSAQRGFVVWIYGLSGSGKTSLASALEQNFRAKGQRTILLDGDRLRNGLNQGLGFSLADRTENIRRAAEVAKMFAQAGTLTICAFITPTRTMRKLARSIVGPDHFLEVYVACSFAECERRDVKGLYAQAKAGEIVNFTGRDSTFEPPEKTDLMLDTEKEKFEVLLKRLEQTVAARISVQGTERSGV